MFGFRYPTAALGLTLVADPHSAAENLATGYAGERLMNLREPVAPGVGAPAPRAIDPQVGEPLPAAPKAETQSPTPKAPDPPPPPSAPLAPVPKTAAPVAQGGSRQQPAPAALATPTVRAPRTKTIPPTPATGAKVSVIELESHTGVTHWKIDTETGVALEILGEVKTTPTEVTVLGVHVMTPGNAPLAVVQNKTSGGAMRALYADFARHIAAQHGVKTVTLVPGTRTTPGFEGKLYPPMTYQIKPTGKTIGEE